MSISHHIRIDEGHNKGKEETVSGCVRNFLGLNCELPWEARRSGITYSECVCSEVKLLYCTPLCSCCLKGMKDNVCNNTDDTKRYYDLMRELQWDMTLPKFIEKTKCHLKSNFSQVNKMKYRSKL